MKQPSNRNTDNLLAMVGFLIALPGIYFFTGSFMKYELNLLASIDILVPPPAVMIGGLLFAIILNVYPLIRQRATIADRAVTSYQVFKARPWNTIILLLGGLYLTLLLGYVVMENLAEIGRFTNV